MSGRYKASFSIFLSLFLTLNRSIKANKLGLKYNNMSTTLSDKKEGEIHLWLRRYYKGV